MDLTQRCRESSDGDGASSTSRPAWTEAVIVDALHENRGIVPKWIHSARTGPNCAIPPIVRVTKATSGLGEP